MFNNLVFDFEYAEANETEIENRLRCLITTPQGTMPLDRNYGIDYSAFIDKPITVAQNAYATAVMDAVSKYEETVTVTSVDFITTDLSKMQAVIRLSKKEAG